MRTPGVMDTLGPMHEDLIRQNLEYFLTIKDLATDAAKFRYRISNPNIQLREPFNFENFELVAMGNEFCEQAHFGWDIGFAAQLFGILHLDIRLYMRCLQIS